jgi:Biotin-requiring enzyme/e3 binding domain
LPPDNGGKKPSQEVLKTISKLIQWLANYRKTGYRTSTIYLAAQNFTMPALSPTMTEGNISSWRVKEGDSFSAGDVLLEIETDKATMDVEAQDDGILAKITRPEGSKAVKVGARIGVIAEPGDDLSSLEIPAEDTASATSSKEEAPSSRTSESQAKAPPSSKASSSATADQLKSTPGKSKPQKYPLLPSVEHLMHLNGLDTSAIEKMKPTGPNGRLLKGDVLAYLGSISSSYPTDLSIKIEKLSHLDLSNIKVAPSPAPKKAETAALPQPPTPPKPITTEVAIPISLAAVLKVQTGIKRVLGTSLPLTTFVARAADIANDDLPCSAITEPSAEDLFNQVLGLDKVSPVSVRGNFMPQIITLSATALETIPRPRQTEAAKNIDVIDFLTGKHPVTLGTRGNSGVFGKQEVGDAATASVFSVRVPRGDEKRARVFLERVKDILESEPGKLFL